jgi:3'-5' exoribonuclease
MSRLYVEEMQDGIELDGVYLSGEKQLKTNKNGNPYIQVELRDRTGFIMGRMWNAGDQQFRVFENGDYIHVLGKVQMFQGALQVILTHIEKADMRRVDVRDFLPRTEQDIGKLTEKLRNYLLKLTNPHLRAIAECFLGDPSFLNSFTACPAGIRIHHAYIGGLLEHVITMMDIADRLIPIYPGVDRELVIMGIFLHDVGKVRELTYSRSFGYTDEGQLIGHIPIGLEMLNEYAAKAPELTDEAIPKEVLVRLKHMILSHHGTLEHGSPKIPMTAEAELLFLIDTLDTRMHQTLREVREDKANSGAWTPYNPNLGRRIYKGGSMGSLLDSQGDD